MIYTVIILGIAFAGIGILWIDDVKKGFKSKQLKQFLIPLLFICFFGFTGISVAVYHITDIVSYSKNPPMITGVIEKIEQRGGKNSAQYIFIGDEILTDTTYDDKLVDGERVYILYYPKLKWVKQVGTEAELKAIDEADSQIKELEESMEELEGITDIVNNIVN